MRKIKRLICFLFGHKWETIPGSSVISKRTFCKRCGIRYHTHTYRNKNNDVLILDEQCNGYNLTQYLKKH